MTDSEAEQKAKQIIKFFKGDFIRYLIPMIISVIVIGIIIWILL